MPRLQLDPVRKVNLEGVPFPALLVQPPYEAPSRILRLEALRSEQLTTGSLIALDVTGMKDPWGRLSRWIPRVRSAFPQAPLLLWMESASVGEIARLARRVGKVGIRAVLLAHEPIAPTLRVTLSEPVRLEADIIEWLTLRRFRLTPDTAFLIQQIFRLAPTHRCLSDVLAALHVSPSSVGAKFGKKLLPAPSCWHHLARALYATLRLQSPGQPSVSRVALEYGYTDHSALSRQLFRNFGMRPTEIRGYLGWEGMMARWTERMRSVEEFDRTGS